MDKVLSPADPANTGPFHLRLTYDPPRPIDPFKVARPEINGGKRTRCRAVVVYSVGHPTRTFRSVHRASGATGQDRHSIMRKCRRHAATGAYCLATKRFPFLFRWATKEETEGVIDA